MSARGNLQIPNPRERAMVAAADAALRPLRWLQRRPAAAEPKRVLLLRLERIGDLLMVLGAIAGARAAWPDAEIDLAVGSWSLPLARLIPGIARVHTADVPWLARDNGGDSWPALIAKARRWRRQGYDLVLNFEPDIRSNFLAWLTGAPRRYGYWTGGGGAFLTDALGYQPAQHVSVNAEALIAHAAGRVIARRPPADLSVPQEARARVVSLLGTKRPLVGVHVSGGRESKQWQLDRFAEVARDVARQRQAAIVLTGSEADRPMVQSVRNQLQGTDVATIDLAGRVDLVDLAAVLTHLDLLITGDTGPMHLASAVGTPVVALFGPSDPRRYGPTAARQRVLRVDLPCSPCGLVRLPPERCRGHVPECMDSIHTAVVVTAALEMLDETAALRQTATD